jgi:two-component system phosphate regulon sensor histidine kinase PhoR
MFSSIRWRMIIPYTVIILIAALGLTLYLSGLVRRVRRTDLEARVLTEARLMADSAAACLGDLSADTIALDTHIRQWATLSGSRVTVVGMDGVVLGDSEVDPANMENHLYRPEISQAIRAGTGTAVRFSRTLGTDLLYVAVLARHDGLVDGEPLGVVRIAIPLQEIELAVGRLSRTIMVSGLLLAVLSIALATTIASRTVNPIRQLTDVVERVAQGDMHARLLPTTRDEMARLTQAFNHMADQLNDKVAMLAQEQTFLSGVLNTMADGVIITDNNGQILLTNPAALRILTFPGKEAQGRTFAQVVREHQLVELWNLCRQSGDEQTGTVETILRNTFLQAVITPLNEPEPTRFLVILQDLTHVRRLETIRRDFISNVSHELRTPLASLSLVVETLKDGAIDDPEAARRFLSYIESELSALTQMVEELLELSQIESGRVPLRLKATPVAKLIKKPIKRLAPQAERMNISVQSIIPDNTPPVLADSRRVQQAVMNLLHNAIKFTPAGGNVTIKAEVVGSEMVISVKDTGLGIPADELSRIFERFYKTDHARADEGTGLGLAIAKHIVLGHGGRIWAESIEGKGSTFYFTLLLGSEPQTEADEQINRNAGNE